MSESDRRAFAVPAPQDAAAFPAQNSVEKRGSLNEAPGTLLTRLCSLDITDAKTLQLYEKIETAAMKYRKEDIKAKRYVRGAHNFASNIITEFEGLQSGRYTREEVFQDFTDDVEHSQHLLIPLEEVIRVLADVADDVSSCIKESGLLASEYQRAGQHLEVMRDATAEISKNQAVGSVLSKLPELLGLSSSGLSAAVAVFSVLSQAASTWGAAQHRKMKENEKLLTALNKELSEVVGIMNKQQRLLGMTYDIIGTDMSEMHNRTEKRLASGTPLTSTIDRIVKAAKELEALCSSFLSR